MKEGVLINSSPGLHICDQKRKPEAKIDKMEKMKQLKNQAMNAGQKGRDESEEI